MTKLGTIVFDDAILDALRDDELVVFAGAGVSMGAPSNLASFWNLTCDIAQGTGLPPCEPPDRFLGQLHHRKVDVHERAARLLSPPESAPNALHRDLLRLFQTGDRVRLVTTNFDRHFETAAKTLFGVVPPAYHAPALPRGYDFLGVVHVHGALPQARDLVLTDADFGRAYLTEGWARRFLVDLFRQYTVLFVGYSHNDLVMNYLARALPADSVARRFVLTDEDGSWDLLGIKPIRFVKGDGAEPFKELYDGVQQLAARSARGALDWRSRLAELGSRVPPTDDEAVSEVEQALREVHTTRFLLEVVRNPKWLRWMNSRHHLDALFRTEDLGERDILLAGWLAQHFTIEHAYEVIEILAAHGLQMNPKLWWGIGCELGDRKETPLDESALKRWVTILLASAPAQAEHYVLVRLAERCARQGCVELTLKVFSHMSGYRLSIKPSFEWSDDQGNERHRGPSAECHLHADHWSLNEVWTAHLKPHHARIAQPLLSGIARRLEEMHSELAAWDEASRAWDPISDGRAAIEPHAQDPYPETVDVLIDAARDTLEWLAANSPTLLGSWMETLVTSDAPILRRLAIHAMTVHPQRSPEERLGWVLDRVGLHRLSEHHEVHRAVAQSYTAASVQARKAVIDAVLAHTRPAIGDTPAKITTARTHFDWLSWLLQAKPDCTLAGAALAPFRAEYPEWQLSEHPDLTHWMGPVDWVLSESPWSAEQILAREPAEQLDDLLTFKDLRFYAPSREGLLSNVREACKRKASWAFALVHALAERSSWASDIWPALVRGLQESDLTIDGWRELLTRVSSPELQAEHTYDIARLLYALVGDGGKPFAIQLLDQANDVALPIWEASDGNAQDQDDLEDWSFHAINMPAGVIVNFWLQSLSLLLRGKDEPERVMPENYRQWFTMVVQDTTTKGGIGRCLLASRAAFLFEVDEAWTRQHIIPLFSHTERRKLAQAWHGFLVWGQLAPGLVEALIPAFLAVFSRHSDLHERRGRFIEFYVSLAVFHVPDPTEQLLPALFQHGSLDDRVVFASRLGYLLRQMEQAAKQQLWNDWLHRYWQDRLQGVFAPLDETEVREMLKWLPYLGDAFPDAVALAVQLKPTRIEPGRVLRQLSNSELVIRFPAETAELLIYVASCSGSYRATDLAKIDARLPRMPVQTRRRIDEAFARAGVPRSRD